MKLAFFVLLHMTVKVSIFRIAPLAARMGLIVASGGQIKLRLRLIFIAFRAMVMLKVIANDGWFSFSSDHIPSHSGGSLLLPPWLIIK